jgi:hypothetical protein
MFAPIRTGSSVAAAIVLGFAVAAGAQDLASTPEDRKDVSLTIYNNDLSLVREVRSVPMRKGEFRLRYEGVTAGIDATTVHLESRSGNVQVIEQNYEYDLLSQAKLLQKYVGREVGYRIKDTGTIGRARLLAANESPVYEVDGKIMFELPGPIVLDAVPEGLAARPTLVWTLEGGSDGKQDVETAYLSNGLSWRADYVLLLEENEKSGGINGWVTLENHSGAAFENAQLKLVAGNVNRIREQMQKEVMAYATDARNAMPVPQFEEESFFEYHMYTLQRRAEIRDQQTKQILFFDSGKVAVDKEYTFRAQPHYFMQGFDAAPGTEHVDVTLRFKNNKENGLGNPIPAGRLRVYKNDKDGAPQFLGENTVRHTPKDETLEFAVGQAFDIVGEHEQVDYRKLGDRVAEMSYRVKIRNHKQEQVQVRVLENFYGDWKIEESSHPATRENSRTCELQAAGAGRRRDRPHVPGADRIVTAPLSGGRPESRPSRAGSP